MTHHDHAVDEPDGRPEDAARPGGLSPRTTQVLALALAVILVAAVITAAFQAGTYADNRALQADREAVLSTASQFALRMDNFDGTKLADYNKSVNEVLTTRAKAQFKESFPAFQQLYRKGKAKGVGKVRVVGLQDIDPDSATALVVHDRLVTSSYGNQQQYLRWTVELDKVQGKWLVDKFSETQ